VIELRLPHEKVLVLQEAQVDTASLLAFLGGHCHSLALALHARTGWPLVAIDNESGECIHVAVRSPDSRIVDITGAHTPAEISGAIIGDTRIRSVKTDDLDRLQQKHGWAEAVPEVAAAWAEPALTIATPLEPMRTPTMRLTRETLSGIEVVVSWDGEPEFLVDVRPADQPDSPLVRYGRIPFPKDADGFWRLSFYVEHFKQTAERWLERSFDEARAQRTLRNVSA
jgi:hypothetical protein